MSKPAPRLGRGLSAILGPRPATALGITASPEPRLEDVRPPSERSTDVLEIPVDQIVPNPHQPRQRFPESSLRELAQSIRAHGVIQPIIVRTDGNGRFELVAGERRWRAARLAGLKMVPAIVREMMGDQSLEIALIENLQREDLTPLERARAYQSYLAMFEVPIEQLAERLGESRSNISNYMRLLRLPEQVQDLIGSGKLGMGQARAIAAIDDAQRQVTLALLAVRRNFSVRQVEALAKRPAESSRQAAGATKISSDRHLDDVAQAMSRALGLPVRLLAGRRKNSGRVVIAYNSLEDFDRIAERICGRVSLE